MSESIQKKSGRVGGAREGAGRPLGAVTKRTREIADKAILEGITPLEVLLRTMRELVDKADTFDEGSEGRLTSLQKASVVAKDACPYIHARLNSIELTGKDGKDLFKMYKGFDPDTV